MFVCINWAFLRHGPRQGNTTAARVSSMMRLQLHHCPLLLWGTASGLRRETADRGDCGRWRGERRQQAGPQAALQGAQCASCTSWQQQQGGAALSVQQKRLIDQLLDNVYLLSPVQIEGWLLLWSCRWSRGGAVSIPGRVVGCLGGVWKRWRRGERWLLLTFVPMWCHTLTSVGYLHICRLLPRLPLVNIPPTIVLFLITALQSFIDGAEARGRGQEDSLAFVCLLQLLLPLHYLLSLFQLFLLLLQLQLEVSPLFHLLFLPHLQRLFFLLLYFLAGFLIFLPRSLLPCLLQRAALLKLQQLFLVLFQPAELWAGRLLPEAPGWEEVSKGEFGRAVRSPTGSDNVAVVSGACCAIGTARVR